MTDADIIVKALSTPSGYSTVRLGVKLHPVHKQVLDTLFSKESNRVSLVAGNGTGKSATVIASAILYALEMRNSLVIVTSGVYRQVTQQIMPNIKKYSYLYKNWEFLENSINIDGVKRLLGFASPEEGTTQGWHSGRDFPNQPLLIIFDEAASIGQGLYNAIERCHPTWMLVAGSPGSPEGMFYDIQNKPQFAKDYSHFKLAAKNCTISKGYWIKDKDLEDMESRWGKDHPLVLSSVYGEFTTNIKDSILSLSSLINCLTNPPPYKEGPRCVGIDFGGGSAESSVYMKIGNKITKEEAFVCSDTMESVDRISKCLNRLKYDYGIIASEVNADSDGLGLPCIDRLNALGWNVNKFHGGVPPEPNSQCEYKNLIAKAWIEGCRKIEKCEVIIPDDDILRMQLLSRKAKLNESGKMQLESKQDMAKRNIESPDRADAMMMAMNGPISSGEIKSIFSYKPSHKMYKNVSF